MKNLILAIGMLVAAVAANAQTIHWITFVDTTDESVGSYDVLGRKVLYSHVINQVNSALAPLGYKSNVLDYYGTATSPENCKAAVQRLNVTSPEDIIVFYYIGHGGRPVTGSNYVTAHPFPQMFLAQNSDERLVPLEWVDEQLKNKGARLAVTIGMCCNSYTQGMTQKERPAFSASFGPTYMSGEKIAKIQDLFLGEKGNVIATSAKPGQSSYTHDSQLGEIDCYTAVIAGIFDDMDSNSKSYTWDSLLNEVKDRVNKIQRGDQTPFHVANLSKVAKSVPAKPAQPTVADITRTEQIQKSESSPSKIEDNKEWLNSLSQNLGSLINTNLSQEKRISLERELAKLFAPDAKVRFLGQDSDTVIDREDAEDFLGRLATSKLLLNVVIVDATLNGNNLISSLKVREIYKK